MLLGETTGKMPMDYENDCSNREGVKLKLTFTTLQWGLTGPVSALLRHIYTHKHTLSHIYLRKHSLANRAIDT